MRGAELLDKIGLADPAYVAAAHAPPERGAIRRRGWQALAACLALAVVSAAVLVQAHNRAATLPKLEQVPVISAAADLPGGMRRMMNYAGMRYVFLEGGAAYSLAPEQLGEAVGVLEYDIQADPEANGKKEFSATYALGGTVYLLADYDPAFRVAVEQDGLYFICQSVGYTQGGDIDPGEYFQKARFPKIVDGVSIYDHMGSELLGSVPAGSVDALVKCLSQAVPAELDSDGYQQIAQAQREGLSYRLSFDLSDGTKYWLYVIPALDIAMIGDGRYTLPDTLSGQFGGLFDGLEQTPPSIGPP